MYYLLWLLILPFSLALTLFCWLTNPLACLFPSRLPNGRDKLWGIFNLWSTHDCPVDEGYYGKYWVTPSNYKTSRLTRYWYRLRWLSRNTGYGWSYLLFSIPKGRGFQLKGQSKPLWGYYNDYNCGWKSHNNIQRLLYACRPIGLRKS